MKSLISLWKRVADESATWCCTNAAKDYETLVARVEHEGFSFLTITLSDYGKDFQKSLDLGHLAPASFASFKRRRGLPVFLRGFLELVFDEADGRLLNDPSIHAIRAIRQLTLMFSKINLPCSSAREKRAFDGYVKCEQEIKGVTLSESDCSDFTRVSSLLFRTVFSDLDRKIYYQEDIIPKHGPGSTADKLSGNGKFRQTTWTNRLEAIFPYGEYCLPNWSFYDQLEAVDFLEPGAELPVKVISVPKTLKTPRIIAMEPTCMQYMQQAVAIPMIEGFGRDSHLSHFLGFDDQVPNQELARSGSISGALATLDLSEASDRVSNQHVRMLVSNHKWLHAALDATRSRRADVPGHGIKRIAKYASMGSALCFPIEACVFITLVMIGIERELKRSLTKEDLKALHGRVRIYGDDLIVPVEYVRSVCDVLHAFGHKVNVDKSFWTGMFRESCGKEYFFGHDVSIVKVRRVFPTSRMDATGCISMVSLRNQLFHAGYFETSRYLDGKIRKVLKFFPKVLPTSPVLGRHEFGGFDTSRIHPDLQTPVVKGYVVEGTPPKNPLEDSGALLKFFLKRSVLPFADRKHLERSGRPHAVGIKLRQWASPI